MKTMIGAAARISDRRTRLAMHLTLTALVAGLVATAGAPSKAMAGCMGMNCTDNYGNTYTDYNGNGRQDPGEPTQYNPCNYGGGPGCPGYRNPTYQQPPQTYQQPYAPRPPKVSGYYTLGSSQVGSKYYNPSVYTSHPRPIFVPTHGFTMMGRNGLPVTSQGYLGGNAFRNYNPSAYTSRPHFGH